MPDEKKSKADEKALATNQRPTNETIGSSEFTETTGAYPVRLPQHPHRSSGEFLLEKFKDL